MPGALRLGAVLALSTPCVALTPCTTAFAHVDPPAAYAILSHDAQGPRAVHLNYGVGLRRGPKRYQFVCPSAWGDQYGSAVAALADGTIVVGAGTGLRLLSEDGTVRPHPDPVAAGNTVELVHTQRGVFSVRSTSAGSEVLAVDAERARVLWKDAKSGYSMAALEDKLVLLRGYDITLEQVILSTLDGQELERQVAVVNMPVDYAFARAAAGNAYALVMFRTVTALGSLRMNAFTRLAEGLLSVAGPLSQGERMLLAPDGKLSQLASGALSPLAEQANVLCLAEHDGLAYACHPEGIARLGDQALGEPLFELSWMVAPDLTRVPEGAARDLCNWQWQDFRIDMMMAGLTLLDETAEGPGGSPADAGIPADASVAAEAAVPDGSAASSDAAEPDAGQVAADEPRRAGGGCSALPESGWNFAAYLYFGLLLVTHRAVSRRSRALARTKWPSWADS
ncbi:MAG TPA: hypothetical protein VFZ61_26295 [Polyangiales bacterium]